MQPAFSKIFAPLLDALPDTIVIVDEGGEIAFVNQAVKTLLGYEPPELVAQPLSILLPPRFRDQHQRLMASFWQDPKSRPMASRPFLYALSKAGEEVPVTISLAPIALGGERCCVASLRDASPMRNQITTMLGGMQV